MAQYKSRTLTMRRLLQVFELALEAIGIKMNSGMSFGSLLGVNWV
jgi:hypothetical protein